jgi:hypothetical protein
MGQYTESWTSDRTGFVVLEGLGAGGLSTSGGGGAYYPAAGGGQYSLVEVVAVVLGTMYTIFRGKGDSNGGTNNQTDMRFGPGGSSNLIAKGGTGAGANPTDVGLGDFPGSVGDIIRFGGNGGPGDPGNDGTAGGGGGAGRHSPGQDGGAAGAVPGLGGVSGDGGPDGDGADGTFNAAGAPGSPPGGGASPGSNFHAGALGGDGSWAVWAPSDWDFTLHEPKPGTVPIAFAGSYIPAPPAPPASGESSSFIM